MNHSEQQIRISNLDIPVKELAEISSASWERRLHLWIAKQCRINEQDVLSYEIRHRSLDARRKPDIKYIYQLDVKVRADSPVHEDANTVVSTPEPDHEHPLYHLPIRLPAPEHPVIVGTGPAGLMAAYLLALYGCKPLILDRGTNVDQRRADIEHFLHTRQLNPESNYLFGEGGAGTYSDGKLYTRIKDHRIKFLLDAYVAARAPRRILYDAHPHIGSDILPFMVKRLRRQIEAWGGMFRWNALVKDILIRNGKCQGVRLHTGELIESPLTLIACGHSARELIQQLVQRGIRHWLKDFQLGCRIEHPQQLIDQGQYGWIPPRQIVGAAEYQFTSRPSAASRAAKATTFCMCPGGEIIAATSDPGHLCTNGMSPFLRNGSYANAGLIVNQSAAQFSGADQAFEMLATLERQAFTLGCGTDQEFAYRCPAQSARAFVRGEAGLASQKTSYRLGITAVRLDQLLPSATVHALREALQYFEKLIAGFLRDGVLIGVETRVSSPVRFERNPETLSSSLPGLYLAGEGAGYAGGITSAALDGLRLAETILTGTPATRKTET
ncbi:FAD dependent oxidoreductase [Candidatus Vecturithrix granuli]|uniref:FAD dependent oxidoreductase n=1 Tax=Vecturithrix granuli TaxID=1499967 RepID=A0A081BXP6_VECG1|nr:FAD dependent oxidoreductase [Candidatus Vecturithrix granuli]